MLRIFLILGVLFSLFFITTSESRAGVIILGACCDEEPSCFITVNFLCTDFQGGGSTGCDPNPCVTPECDGDGDCEPSGDVCAPNICESNVCVVSDPIPDCCAANDECDDENFCTADVCIGLTEDTGGVCGADPILGCCNQNADCADDDECTIDLCVNPGEGSSCSNDFNVEDDVCFCRENPDDIDRGCAEAPIETGPVVIIPTIGQWGMIIATIFLGFFAVIALRRRTKS